MHWVAKGSLLIIYKIPDICNKINWNFREGEIIERGFCPKHMDKNGPINRHCIYVFFIILTGLVFEIKMDKVRVYRRAKSNSCSLEE
jgi:hypothetical protein